jgi:protein-disulfide isomerase
MNPNPDPSSAPPGALPAITPPPGAPPVARASISLGEVRLSRGWLIAIVTVGVLTVAGAIIGGANALIGMREGSQQQQLAAIHGELIRIRQLLEAEPNSDDEDVQAQQTARLNISGQPSLGSPSAPLTLVEFTDFQCPFCARFHSQTFPLLRKAFIESGRVRYVTMDFPLSSIHSEAFSAARAAHCGEEQGRYWDTHEALYNQRGHLDHSDLVSTAKGIGLNVQRFSVCLDGDANDGRIKQGLDRGRGIGVSGTPTFVLGRVVGNTVVGRVIVGAQPYEVFDDMIRSMLDMS